MRSNAGAGSGSAMRHIPVNNMSFSIVILHLPRRIEVELRPGAIIQKEVTMFDQARIIQCADQEWRGWPNDMRLRASVVIATTRCAWTWLWSVPRSGDDIDLDCTGFEHPLLRRALDSNSRRTGRATSRRRASGPVAS
jgi:hypothetical protein